MENPAALLQKRSRLAHSGFESIDKALREGRALRPGEELDLQGIEAQIASIDRTLGYANSLSQSLEQPITGFTRCAIALASNRGHHRNASHHPGLQGATELTRALSASNAPSGGFAVPQTFSREFIQQLRPFSAIRRLSPTILEMPNGNFTWPRISTGVSAGYVSENATVPEVQAIFSSLSLSAKKLAALVPTSNTLLRSAGPAAMAAIEADMVAAVGQAEDVAFIRGDGTQQQPRGLRSWVLPANLITASSTVDVTHIDSDLASLELALTSANVKFLRPGWILSVRSANFLQTLRHPTSGIRCYPEMDNGLLRGKPFAATTNIPTNLGTGAQSEIYLADFADVVIAEYPELIIDIAAGGTYIDSAGAHIAAFSVDQSIIRVISQHDLGLRHDESLAILQGVNY